MKAFAAGLLGLLLGVGLGAGGLMWFHHHRPHHSRHEADNHADHHHGSAQQAQPASAAAAPAPAAENPAYLVVLGEVYDREKFASEYVAKLPPLYEKFGGRYLAVGRDFEVFEGNANFKSFVISQWPSMAAARAFWNSPEYEALRRARIEGQWGRFDVYALEGLAEPRQSATPAAAPK